MGGLRWAAPLALGLGLGACAPVTQSGVAFHVTDAQANVADVSLSALPLRAGQVWRVQGVVSGSTTSIVVPVAALVNEGATFSSMSAAQRLQMRLSGGSGVTLNTLTNELSFAWSSGGDAALFTCTVRQARPDASTLAGTLTLQAGRSTQTGSCTAAVTLDRTSGT
ncbi:hypothetical protein [Deinococcus maricopensis]|uniref:Lipoprotein n=1 Tax=Deinococcus maricopensis (strain DSM 21211 / LMG 22137 / NRRL B-23946 / LB-34) TaxID=709986 RepID=E8UAS6_DEIML|nr:hypothetical protein [Deinococcus maricopensis]ADV68165.1 hypothetical protein Deima_2531 [Deinococcus maricopensis DSM 21211]